VTHIGYLLATSDNEIGEIGPSPKGCGENRAILRCSPSLGMAKAFVLRLVWHDFRSQRRHSYMSIRPREDANDLEGLSAAAVMGPLKPSSHIECLREKAPAIAGAFSWRREFNYIVGTRLGTMFPAFTCSNSAVRVAISVYIEAA